MKKSWTDDALVYRYTTREDLPAIVELLGDPEVGRWLWFTPATAETIEAYFAPLLDAQADELARGEVPTSAELVVFDRSTGELLGQGAAMTVEGSPGGYEIGYQTARRSWGRGNGRRIARFCTAFAVHLKGAHRIQAGTLAGNAASIAILEGLGLRLEGTLREFRLLRGRRCDELLYGAPVSELETEAIRNWALAAGLIGGDDRAAPSPETHR